MKAQPRGTDGSLLASLPWTLAALAVSLAPHIPYFPFWISGAFIGCAGWRYFVERQRRMLPSRWIRAGLALACFLGVYFTYSSISGVGPGSALLAIMAGLKLLETRKRRDQFVLLFISIFLVMSSLLREQHLWSLPYMIVSLLTILTAWLRMSAGESETPKQSLRTGSRLLLYAAPLAIAMWVFFPRLSSPFWAVPVDTSQASSGLSDMMSPGDISSLSLSNEVAFRVRFDGAVPDPRDRYWRGLVLTKFNGRSWAHRGDPVHVGPRADQQISFFGDPISYEVTLEPTRQHWVFALDLPREWMLDKTFMGNEQQLARTTPIEQRIAYKMVSYPNYQVLTHPPKNGWYTSLPAGGNQRSKNLAVDMRNAADSDADYIDAVMRMFNQEEFFYTLEPPPLGNSPIDRFLFDTRRGFCEHYASAFAFMMRSAGLPSRIVLGYQGGEINPIGGHLIVRQSDAHAWTEVWLDELGWYRVDPTAAVAPERIEYGTRDPANEGLAAAWGFASQSEFMYQLVMTWDAVNAKWNDWILGYGPDTQNQFMKWLGMVDPSWRKMILTLLAIVITMVVAISGLLMLRYRAPAKDRATRLYEAFIRKSGLERRIGETPNDFAHRVIAKKSMRHADVISVTRAYLDARYGPFDDNALLRLKQAIGTIG